MNAREAKRQATQTLAGLARDFGEPDPKVRKALAELADELERRIGLLPRKAKVDPIDPDQQSLFGSEEL